MPSPAQTKTPPDAPPPAGEAERTDALRLAFAAPIDRARAAGLPLDRISLREHVREVEIGAFQQERGRRQRVRFDIVAEVTPTPGAGVSDDVDGILSYDTLIEAIDTELDAERLNLLETLAERLAARVLMHDRAARVFVRIEKLDLGPHVLGVEIVRARDEGATPRAEGGVPRPHVLLLPAGAQDAPGLPALLDRLAAAPAPAVLVATPDFAAPRATHALPQRRLDLLALEQAAWRLADRDRRCIVVDSRTELDWSMRQRRLSVWAPARLVLDATHGPADVTPETLARWFAEAFHAAATTLPDALTADLAGDLART